ILSCQKNKGVGENPDIIRFFGRRDLLTEQCSTVSDNRQVSKQAKKPLQNLAFFVIKCYT
ncbi:MAG: hypothetical protein K2J79_01140, partial [Ruminiclostridium sp.]|nr:hypothetical protein [Ruminiclostridium sp.]